MTLFSFLLSGSLQAEPLSLETDKALAVHLSQHGLNRIGEALAQLIPTSVPISGASSSFECSSDSSIDYTVGDIDIMVSMDQVLFTPDNGTLRLDIFGSFQSNMVQIDLVGDCSVFSDLEETCDLKLPTTGFHFGIDVSLAFENGNLTAEASAIDAEISPIGNPLSNCLISDAVNTVLGQQPTLINDLLLPSLNDELEDIPNDIEESLVDFLDELYVDSNVDLLGSQVDISLFPSEVTIDSSGVLIGLGGRVETEIPDDGCADTQTHQSSEDSPWPTMDGTTLRSTLTYDSALFLSKPFMDNLLYGIWASGSLCIDASELTGLELNGELAGNFFSPEVTELLGSTPVGLNLNVQKPPKTIFSDDQPPIAIRIEDLMLELNGSVDERMTRVLGVDIDADIGAYFYASQNQFSADLPLASEDFILSEAYSELVSPGYSEGVPALLDLALANFDVDLPVLYLPVPLHIEINQLVWEPSSDGNWQGGYVYLDTSNVTPLEIPGCATSDFGCDGGPSVELDLDSQLGCDQELSGCEGGGCASAGTVQIPLTRIMGAFFVFVGAMLRRRS